MSKINVFSEGEKIQGSYLVNQVSRGITNTGSPYLNLLLQDNTGTIDGKLWNVAEEISNVIKAGQIVAIQADVLKYKQNLQLKVLTLSIQDASQMDLSEFVSSGVYTRAFLKEEIGKYILSIKNPIYATLVKKTLAINPEAFFEFPAASRNHHDFVGGLATHVYGMLRLAEQLVNLYPELNRDLLYAGVIVHDFGKIVEYSGPILAEFTTEGKLLGHISIINAYLYHVAVEAGLDQEEESLLLRHLVLSHHGEYEYGSPVLPMVMEAEMLNFIDNIDARMNMFDKALSTLEEGTFTPRIFSLENRSFYKPKTKKNDAE